jgi:hypothetical protein
VAKREARQRVALTSFARAQIADSMGARFLDIAARLILGASLVRQVHVRQVKLVILQCDSFSVSLHFITVFRFIRSIESITRYEI